MSRWLQNVGQFLEKLDDRAEWVASDHHQQLPLQPLPLSLAASASTSSSSSVPGSTLINTTATTSSTTATPLSGNNNNNNNSRFPSGVAALVGAATVGAAIMGRHHRIDHDNDDNDIDWMVGDGKSRNAVPSTKSIDHIVASRGLSNTFETTTTSSVQENNNNKSNNNNTTMASLGTPLEGISEHKRQPDTSATTTTTTTTIVAAEVQDHHELIVLAPDDSWNQDETNFEDVDMDPPQLSLALDHSVSQTVVKAREAEDDPEMSPTCSDTIISNIKEDDTHKLSHSTMDATTGSVEVGPKHANNTSTMFVTAIDSTNNTTMESSSPPSIVMTSLQNQQQQEQDQEPTAAVPSTPIVPSSPPLQQQQQQQEEAAAVAAAAFVTTRELRNENHTLRRHLVSLNTQLEIAEAEMMALRQELNRAAERIERDQIRFKEEKQREKVRHGDEMKLLKLQHEQVMREMKIRSDQQIEIIRKQLKDVEERRMQEGGDWNKEIADSVRREQEMAEQIAILQDEKSTFLSHISTLQLQQEALGLRLESLSQTADNAMDHEREAERRLDEALSLHARQIGQRQSREAELERTVADLGAALVEARNRQSSSGSGGGSSSSSTNATDGSVLMTATELIMMQSHDQAAGDATSQEERAFQYRKQSEHLELEIETLRAQLTHERQRNDALKQELHDITQERKDETSLAQVRQQQHDRQISDLALTVAKLKAELRESKKDSIRNSFHRDQSLADQEDMNQIKQLSEEVVRQRGKAANYKSEVAALKSRLQAAMDRVAKAEAAVESNETSDDMRDLERAPSSNGGGILARRRGGKRSRITGARSVEHFARSMKSALFLDGARGGSGSEKIGEGLDALDDILVKSGHMLRFNPYARFFFVLYMTVLHLWTFLLLFFHAHQMDTTYNNNFGSIGMLSPPRPDNLLQNQIHLDAPVEVPPQHEEAKLENSN